MDHQPVLEHQPVAEGVFFQQYYVAESIPTYSHFNGNSKYDPNDPQRDRLVQKPLGSSVLPLRSRERLPGLGSQFSDMPETNIYEIKLRRLGLQTLTCSIFLVLFKKKHGFIDEGKSLQKVIIVEEELDAIDVDVLEKLGGFT